MKPASWVIVQKDTNQAIFETYNEKAVKAINTEKYQAIPIFEYLANLNRQIKLASH